MALQYNELYICYSSTIRIMLVLKKRFYLFIFWRERGKEGERKGEKYCRKKETSIGCLLYVPWQGTKPATQACTLTGNRTGDLPLCGMMSNQLTHIGQDQDHMFLRYVLDLTYSYLSLVLPLCEHFSVKNLHQFGSSKPFRVSPFPSV